MTRPDVLAEIRSLKSDLNTFSDRMVRLRYEDLKGAFLEQMRMAVGEAGKRTFQDDASNLHDSSGCRLKAECLGKLGAAVDEAAGSFMRDDLPGARRTLDEVEALLKGDCSPCQDGECSQAAAEILRRVRAILQIYEGLAERFGPELMVRRDPLEGPHRFSAEDIESVLDPLANAWRIKVLDTLRGGEHSLTELGRAVDLKTGHLQFHLRALMDAGYVTLDRRKHRYFLTERGEVALSCTEDMVSKLSPGPPRPGGKGVALDGTGRATDAR